MPRHQPISRLFHLAKCKPIKMEIIQKCLEMARRFWPANILTDIHQFRKSLGRRPFGLICIRRGYLYFYSGAEQVQCDGRVYNR